MLTHREIIEKLTTEQKISLLADVASLGGITLQGERVRFLSETSMQAMNGKEGETYPSFAGLANSWNVDLIGKVADSLARRAKEHGYTLLNVPAANVMVTPYSSGVSEDPYLSGTFANAWAGAGMRTGVKTCIAEPALRPSDVAFSDAECDPRALHEYFFKPFDMAVKQNGCMLKTARPKLGGSYENVNAEYLDKAVGKAPVVIDCKKSKDSMALMFEKNVLCKNASKTALRTAVERYLALNTSFENGDITLGELETECREGNAVSPEMLDDAVDRILDFSFRCAKMQPKAEMGATAVTDEKLALRAAEQSVVLLKNEKVLPFDKHKKIALIGDLAQKTDDPSVESLRARIEALTRQYKLASIGFARGYDSDRDRSDDLIKEACTLAEKADIAVVVVGYSGKGKERAIRNKTARLPANQQVLLERLAKGKAKVVAVVCGEHYPDMRFDNACDAVLLAPLDGSRSAQAVTRILMGETSPSGKLAFTCYTNTEDYFSTVRAYKDAGRNKVGTFYGYRNYDSSGLRIKYPFGFGLSYSRFTYSKLKRAADGFRFTVKNTGSFAASEVVQVYVGKRGSAVVRPRKELKAFYRVSLRPGESKTVSVPIGKLDLSVYDARKKRFATESGQYEIYIGSSVRDIHLKDRFYAGTETLESDKKSLSEYVQSKSNVLTEKYYLDVPVKLPAEKSKKARVFAVAASIVILCLDLVFLYFDYIRWIPKKWWIYLIVAAITAAPITFATILSTRRKNQIRECLEKNMEEKKQNREKLNIEDLADEIPYEQLFAEEFATTYEFEEEEKPAEEEQEKAKEETRVVSGPFDADFTMPLVFNEFTTFAYERGIALDIAGVRSLFSAFASSRLIILNCEDREMLERFIPVLGDYLGCTPSVDDYEENDGAENLLYRKNMIGISALTNTAHQLMRTSLADGIVHIATLRDVRCEGIKSYLSPVIRYVDQPEHRVELAVKTDAQNEQSHEISENVWLVVTLADGEKISDVPKYLLDMACVVDLSLRIGEEPRKRMIVQSGEAENAEQTPAEKEVEMETVEIEEEIEVEIEVEEAAENTVDSDADDDSWFGVTVSAKNTPKKTKKKVKQIVKKTIQRPKVSAGPKELKVVETVVETEKTVVKKLTFWQFDQLAKNAYRDYQMDEVLWKRVDKLEEFVDGCGEYQIENKLWQRMEKYISVFLAGGGLEEEALDSVVACHLIPGMLACVENAKKPSEEKFSHTLENIFGEGHAPCSLKAVKSSGLDI
ncbi:MAG: glycoside hydrolase family 3 C-terminal domain-containing protein [Clostridia bacterium]|nr:glycoside hydrolase family 3 C-terminal domain-containing protein [Clostridia bacterium]